MLKELVSERKLPKLLSAEDMKHLLLQDEYGFLPNVSYKMSVSEPVSIEKAYCSERAEHSYVDMTITVEDRSHTFRVNRLLHSDGKKHPFFVLINFYSDLPNRYCPLEMIAEEGFSLLSVCYQDVASDDADFTNGLAKVLLPNGQETDETGGKIAIWAWALMRVMDYAQTLDSLDLSQAAVIGHSRLGKTALLTSMLDNRFRYAFSNDSGCSGAALARGSSGLSKTENYRGGETIDVITTVFPYWFCKKYRSYAKDGFVPGCDQHFLLSSIAPRFVYVASASMDDWADPTSEFLCCVAASEQYEKLGYSGLVHLDRLPNVPEHFHEGRIGYHKREGAHFLSIKDWDLYMKYIRLHEHDSI